MADTIGRGVIELVADATKVRAGVEEAKKSIRTLADGQRDVGKRASKSIDEYIGKLNLQNSAIGKSAREVELLKLAYRGASQEQIKAADAALRFRENQERTAQSVQSLRSGFIAFGAIATASLLAAAVAFDRLTKSAANFQDLAEKVGDTGENIASLAVAASVGGVGMDAVAAASVRLTKNLNEVTDESSDAGAAITALGLNLADFKTLAPADQIETIAKALSGFQDGAQKTAVAVALFGKAGAEMLPFMRELAGATGRQNILTKEQIDLADEYADNQARATAQISLHAQAIATSLLPQITSFINGLSDIVKGQDFATAASGALQTALNGAIVVFQSIAVLVSDVAFVFHELGRGVGAAAANLGAIARLDFQGVRTIFKEVSADSEAARAKLDKFQASIMALGQVNEFSNVKPGRSSTTDKPKPKLAFAGGIKKLSGAGGGAQDDGRAEAQAQLALDLDRIRKASEEQINVFANAEKIMQAMRAADLVNDRDYYASKLGFIQLNAQEQEKALQQEIARLQRETFSGKTADKDRLDNQRKIADAESKLAKVRADATANIQINSIQEAAALKKVQQGFEDARAAAAAYLDTIARQNAREVQGIGKGNKFRSQQADISAIEDRALAERRRLEGELRRGDIDRTQFDTYLQVATETYKREVELYEQRTAAIDEAQANWLNGATEALQNYIDESKDVASQVAGAFTNAFTGLEDLLVEISTNGIKSFDDLKDAANKLATSIVADINRILIKKNITEPLAEFIQGNIGDIGGFFGLPTGAKGGIGGAAGEAANAAVFGTAVATAGATFAAETAVAGATVATELVAGGTTLALEIATAGATFAVEVAGAGAAFAASVATASAAGGAASGAGGLISGVLDSFATGVAYVPKTGPYMLHQGERVVPAAENRGSGSQQSVVIHNNWAAGTDRATVDYAVAEMERRFAKRQRRMA
jgi:lambda family phage tail tape measure protein